MATKSTDFEKYAVQQNLVSSAKEAQRRNAGTGIDDNLGDEVRIQTDEMNRLTAAGSGRGQVNPPAVRQSKVSTPYTIKR